ncbi:hypothetical protein LXL04_003461 [Taraxacum kok-saghyz]
MLDEMDRALHDALCIVKRTLESNTVVAGGGAVEAALSVYLEYLATTLGSCEQLAIAEFAEALLIIPKSSRAREAHTFHELELELEIEARGELEPSFELETVQMRTIIEFKNARTNLGHLFFMLKKTSYIITYDFTHAGGKNIRPWNITDKHPITILIFVAGNIFRTVKQIHQLALVHEVYHSLSPVEVEKHTHGEGTKHFG